MNLKDRRALVVDDEPFTLSLVVRLLKEIGIGTIESARTGTVAMDLLLDRYGAPIDFALIDFNMPGMTGLDLLKAIRTGKCGPRRGLPVAMLTGNSSRDLVGTAMALDVNAFLVKPTSRATLAGRIERMLAEEVYVQDVATYAALDVPAAMKLTGPDRRETVSIPAARREVDGSHAPMAARPASPPPHNHAPALVETVEYGPRMRCAIADLTEDAILADDILNGRGICLVRAGIKLTRRTLSRLRDLAELNEIDHAWVRLPVPSASEVGLPVS